MTQMTVTLDLEDNANPSEIRKFLKNIKGVVKVTPLKRNMSKVNRIKQNDKEWLTMIDKLINSVDPTEIDMTDERTRYIMSNRK